MTRTVTATITFTFDADDLENQEHIDEYLLDINSTIGQYGVIKSAVATYSEVTYPAKIVDFA